MGGKRDNFLYRSLSQIKQQENDSSDSNTVRSWFAVLVMVLGTSVFMLVYWNFTALPRPLTIQDEYSTPDLFIAERAYHDLEFLTEKGPRVTGSEVNEVYAVGYLMDAVQKIIGGSNIKHKIEVDHQIATSDFYLPEDDRYGVVSVYRSLQNIVVKLSSASGPEPEHSILLNAHFDSVPTSPGAGDDGSMTVVMLEILRVLGKSTDSLRHSVIFLFNGSEENILQGAHAFITLHKWAHTVRAFINMDSAGSGGREIMFQAGPKHPWLMNYYRKTAKHPYASAMGEELFQSNFIPSDTDFRQFRDFGHIPGFDFAYNTNGYKYHTEYDSLDSINQGSLQHTGENILALVKALGNAEEVEDTKAHETGKVVYFDYLNWFMVYYTETVGIIINSVFSGAVIISIFTSVVVMSKRDKTTETTTFKEFGFIVITQTLTLVITIGLVLLLSVIYDACGRSLSWLSSTWLIFGLYYCPIFFGLAIGPIVYVKYCRRIFKIANTDVTLGHIAQMFIHAQILFLTLITIVLTILNVRSAYIPMISILFYAFFNTFNIILQNYTKHKHTWIYMHFLGLLFPYLYYCSLALTAYATFIPIQARNGPSSNPETMIGLLSVLFGVLLAGQIMPLIILCRNRVLVSMMFVCLTVLTIIIMVTPIGFPYREKTAPQRYWVHHIQQKFHDSSQTRAGFYFRPMDRHAFKYVNEFLDETKFVAHDCTGKILCGYPHYHYYEYAVIERSKFYPSEMRPTYKIATELSLRQTAIINNATKQYSFNLSGPDHMSLYISPLPGTKLVAWSFRSELPEPDIDNRNGRDLYYVALLSANLDDRPFEIDLIVRTEGAITSDDAKLEIGVVGQYMHQLDDRTSEFVEFLETFPKYSVQYNWVSTYESYLFN